VAIEANKQLPGTRTNSAEVVFVDDINGHGLIDSLVSLSTSVSEFGLPVLFLTNDTMVATVGTHYEKLGHLYKLSWGGSRRAILPLLRKEEIEKRCRSTGLLHPKTKIIRNSLDATPTNLGLTFPVIFKPDRPVSAYKTLVVDDKNQLARSIPTIETSLPSIAQEYIAGGDSQIRFAGLYLVDGGVAARFEGRKLRSRPMGHTTIAISEKNDQMHSLALEFFDGLGISGPVSLEAKEDSYSRSWIIEPTVGRTDFWVGLCINDGVDFPLLEYRHLCGQSLALEPQRNRTLWINGERDPAALARLTIKYPRYLRQKCIVGVFLDSKDIRPILRWSTTFFRALPVRAAKKLIKVLRSGISFVK
jgi:predicted ATP-grasp superfamily ATP-dependent carboligase